MVSSGIDCERKRCGYNDGYVDRSKRGRCWYTPSLDEKGRCRHRHESTSGEKWVRRRKS